MISQTEENYLKAIYKIIERKAKLASTNAISKEIKTSAASVTDMLKRLSKKGYLNYEKHKGVSLTEEGEQISLHLIRKHRLWETFLVNKLDFQWDEVHDIAEQLEHIQSKKLITKMDQYLGYPKFDPHGDPIPDENGNFTIRNQIPLSDLNQGESGIVVGVQEHSTEFLQYLNKLELGLGTQIEILEKYSYEHSIKIQFNEDKVHTLTNKIGQNLFVTKK